MSKINKFFWTNALPNDPSILAYGTYSAAIEPQESYQQALLRELHEELGIIPTAWTQIEIFPEPDPARHGEGQYIFFLVTAWNGTPTNRQLHEHTRIEWFSLDQAVRLGLAHPLYPHLFYAAFDKR